MAKKDEITPSDKLLKAIWGDKYKTEAEIEAEIEEAANSVTDEEFENTWGCTLKQHTDKTMLFVGWCESVSKWEMEHYKDKKYHFGGDFEPRFSYRQVVDMVQMAYEMGQKDSKDGIAEYDRLWRLNKLDVYVTDEKVIEPKFKVGDKPHYKDNTEEIITILSVDNDYYVDASWAGVPQHLPFEYVEKNYKL